MLKDLTNTIEHLAAAVLELAKEINATRAYRKELLEKEQKASREAAESLVSLLKRRAERAKAAAEEVPQGCNHAPEDLFPCPYKPLKAGLHRLDNVALSMGVSQKDAHGICKKEGIQTLKVGKCYRIDDAGVAALWKAIAGTKENK